MKIGRFYKDVCDEKITYVLSQITDEEILGVRQVCERYGNEEADVRYYDAYEVESACGKKILKQASAREVFNYETYLAGKSLAVPMYFGKYADGDVNWILIENIEGDDLRNMTDALALAAADRLAEMQNEYWEKKTDDRFDIYWKRIQKRANFLENEPKLKEAYQLFLNRQLECPRTLSNGDFLQFNVIEHKDDVRIIDWGFGGIMPYSLDIARFIAHGTKDACTFPFYMTDGQKELFVKRVYEKLEQKPEYSQYLQDIRLAVLNEYIEFVEADEDDDKWYYQHAWELAKQL